MAKLKKESEFQKSLIDRLEQTFPGCMIMKLDASYIQGIPDLLILYDDKWATLECKRSKNENRQPNQEYYVNLMNQMSFSAFIFPENLEEVLYELQESFQS